MANEFADAIRASADRLGVNASDLATIMSYESGFKADAWGGKGGNYYGLIQMGPEERAKYGVKPGESTPVDQVGAAENFLRDRGVKPGMGILDLYSTVNAGRPGLYNRSDAANGGQPGTVADKVASMGAHRMRANALLGGETTLPAQSAPQVASAPSGAPAPAAAPDGAPLSLAGGDQSPDPMAGLMAALNAVPKMLEQDAPLKAPALEIKYATPLAMIRARAAAAALRRA